MSPLVTPAELSALLNDGDVTLLDVRWRLMGPPGRDDYDTGHLPGAVFVDLDADLCGPPGAGGRHPLPAVPQLQSALRRAGVRADRPVVVYDLGDGLSAARAWWTLRWAGHPDVRVLDGGFAAWTGEVTKDVPEADPGDFTVVPGGMPTVVADDLPELDGTLIDVRAPERYRGEVEPIDPVAGHIPGAVNAPTADNLADGRFRAATELRERFAGIAPRAAAVYCGSGVTAAHTILAMHVAGRTGDALYVGSWSDWITDPSRPIETGDAA
ncbi:thiosulfate/3-mercaptopyruvate sulfurtransferase [Allocatelliglobosispora scoriae]|uniref:Thiosulfate/3-mercaptopyruvate sulfurtransferase n=1 Tax=Allocatelliglobosispora scoriae TaxID=643052 RepID=A0A841BW13_9ACTN|nr:sulfurtransferase [Allocatelliglobosispora scoriae]MBB5872354.1 thiosulfate/3-mercaptopyruvate sulfurtransferase [Allocatelliglobosispora scoriae]